MAYGYYNAPFKMAQYLFQCIEAMNVIADKEGLDIQGAYYDKMEYNAHREDHKTENRLKENGKKY